MADVLVQIVVRACPCLFQPIVVRFASALFSIIVFACISNKGKQNNTCVYNENGVACDYGVSISVISFFASVAFLLTDFVKYSIQNAIVKISIMVLDLVFSGMSSLLWLVAYWQLSTSWELNKDKHTFFSSVKVNAVVTIAFSGLTWLVWSCQTFYVIFCLLDEQSLRTDTRTRRYYESIP